MAATHVSKVYAIKEARISPLLSDVVGTSAVYGTSVQLVGSKKLEITGTINSKELHGDNQLLDGDAAWVGLAGKIDHGKLNLDALQVLFNSGFGVVDTGTSPNQQAQMQLKSTDPLQFFKLDARSASADPVGGDIWFSIVKCKMSTFPTLGLNEEDYQFTSFGFVAMPRITDQVMLIPTIRQTAVTLT